MIWISYDSEVSQDKQGDYLKSSCIQDQHTKMDNVC